MATTPECRICGCFIFRGLIICEDCLKDYEIIDRWRIEQFWRRLREVKDTIEKLESGKESEQPYAFKYGMLCASLTALFNSVEILGLVHKEKEGEEK